MNRPEPATRQPSLQERFIARCREDVAQFPALMERGVAGDAAAATQLLELAHRMAGTGGALGFTALSDAAFEIDQMLFESAPRALTDPVQVAPLRAAVARLQAAVAAGVC